MSRKNVTVSFLYLGIDSCIGGLSQDLQGWVKIGSLQKNQVRAGSSHSEARNTTVAKFD